MGVEYAIACKTHGVRYGDSKNYPALWFSLMFLDKYSPCYLSYGYYGYWDCEFIYINDDRNTPIRDDETGFDIYPKYECKPDLDLLEDCIVRLSNQLNYYKNKLNISEESHNRI